MSQFEPFKNDSQSLTIGNGNGITFENGFDEIIVYGDITITKDTDPSIINALINVLTTIENNLIS